jgi:hypothetical protein
VTIWNGTIPAQTAVIGDQIVRRVAYSAAAASMPAITEMNTMARPRSSTGREKIESIDLHPDYWPRPEGRPHRDGTDPLFQFYFAL